MCVHVCGPIQLSVLNTQRTQMATVPKNNNIIVSSISTVSAIICIIKNVTLNACTFG